MTLRAPLIVQQGATFEMDLIRSLDDAGAQPIDITGGKVRVQFRKSFDAVAAVYSANSEDDDSDLTITGEDGLVQWRIPPETTAAFTAPFEGVYDVLFEDAAGNIDRWVEGPLTITPGVTRNA